MTPEPTPLESLATALRDAFDLLRAAEIADETAADAFPAARAVALAARARITAGLDALEAHKDALASGETADAAHRRGWREALATVRGVARGPMVDPLDPDVRADLSRTVDMLRGAGLGAKTLDGRETL